MTIVDCAPAQPLELDLWATTVSRPREDGVRELSQVLPEVLARYGLGFDASLALVGAVRRA